MGMTIFYDSENDLATLKQILMITKFKLHLTLKTELRMPQVQNLQL